MAKKKTEYKVNVLGTEYSIRLTNEKKDPELKTLNGYCLSLAKQIVVDDKPNDATTDSITKRTIRHELLHAFFYESGLDNEAPWSAHEEELVDWFALQLPKIVKACKEVDAL